MKSPLNLAALDFRNSVAVRALITQLTGVSRLGVVVSPDKEEKLDFAIVHSEFKDFILFKHDAFHFIRECRGSIILRTWIHDPEDKIDSPEEIAMFAEKLMVNPLELTYLYTERSDFIWRDRFNEHLPRRLRRHYSLTRNSRLIIHSQQEDVARGSIQHYVIQHRMRFWDYKVLSYLDSALKPAQEIIQDIAPANSLPF